MHKKKRKKRIGKKREKKPSKRNGKRLGDKIRLEEKRKQIKRKTLDQSNRAYEI